MDLNQRDNTIAYNAYCHCCEYYKADFNAFVGIDPDDRSYHLFSMPEQIERYARHLAFWDLKKNALGLESLNALDMERVQRHSFVSNERIRMCKIIDQKFNTEQVLKIYKRADALCEPKR